MIMIIYTIISIVGGKYENIPTQQLKPRTSMTQITVKLILVFLYLSPGSVIIAGGQTTELLQIGNTGQCSSMVEREWAQNKLYDIINSAITNITDCPECGPGLWRRVFYLNASRSDQSYPGQWNLVASPIRGCAGADESCRSAFSDVINTAYSKVCGRIIGEGAVLPDAFNRSQQINIEGNYLDGVSVTHGASGSRTHIWSFGAGHGGVGARCPCDNSNRNIAPLPLAEVGKNYFCDRVDGLDPLWTGESCMNDNPCCSFHNPPYFSVQLPAATTDRIELRICTDENFAVEPVSVLLAELYVQ